MNRSIRNLLMSAAMCASPMFLMNALAATPQGTSFTYQGRLTDGGAPANGAYDIEVRLFDSSAGGLQVGSTITLNDQSVVNGVFSASLDFGAQFSGNARWLELRVRPGASVGAYTTILPRTLLDSTPYAQALQLPVSETLGVTGNMLSFTNTNAAGTGFGTKSSALSLTLTAPSGNYPSLFFGPVFSADTSTGNGIFALTSSDGAYGVYAVSSGDGGRAIVASNTGTSGQVATLNASNSTNTSNALEVTTSGTGSAGVFTNNNASSTQSTLSATNAGTGSSIPSASQVKGIAIRGEGTGAFGIGVMGKGVEAGVYGYSGTTGSSGVYGRCGGGGGDVTGGVRGDGNGAGTAGVQGFNNFGIAIYGQAGGSGSYAGYFAGDVHVNGTLSKSSGSFKIDHPLDPANKYLNHSFVEAPNMMNMYDGITKLDDKGEATVQLPSYFEALNIDYRYQLTCVGGSAPVYISEEVSHNQFKIAGGKPGMKVSWLVTGTRNDPYAQYHRIVPEVEKKADEKGRYLDAADYGQPAEKQLGRSTATLKN